MKDNQRNQIIVLVAIVCVAAVYFYFSMLIFPLRHERSMVTADLEKEQKAMDGEAAELKQLVAVERVEKANEPLDKIEEQLLATMPKAPLVTCPDILSKIVRDNGINTKPRLEFVLPFPSTLSLILHGWAVHPNHVKTFSVGKMVADLENRFPMGQVSQISLQANHEEGGVNASVVIHLAVKP